MRRIILHLKRLWQAALGRIYATVTGRPPYQRRYAALGDYRGHADNEPEYDIVYVLPPDHMGVWILQAICREIDRYFQGSSFMVRFPDRLPTARAYFYSHYGYFRDVLLAQPEVQRGRNILFYTHPRELWFSEAELYHSFTYADVALSMSSLFARHLEEKGVPNVQLALTGADRDFFHSHERGGGAVGFCSGYYPRKNGDLMLEIIRLMPDTRFRLCGRHWRQWERWEELSALDNFDYIEIEYDHYPEFYTSLDVIVSVSVLEGGPIPLIEAMMSNVVPVASRTGHAPDLIAHGDNGFLFDVGSAASEICGLIAKAMRLKGDIRKTVEHLTWERFSAQVVAAAGL